MKRQGLKQIVLDAIKSDSILYGKIGWELNMSPASLPRLIYDNDKRLTQVGVLKILAKHLNMKQNELLETIQPTNVEQ